MNENENLEKIPDYVITHVTDPKNIEDIRIEVCKLKIFDIKSPTKFKINFGKKKVFDIPTIVTMMAKGFKFVMVSQPEKDLINNSKLKCSYFTADSNSFEFRGPDGTHTKYIPNFQKQLSLN